MDPISITFLTQDQLIPKPLKYDTVTMFFVAYSHQLSPSVQVVHTHQCCHKKIQPSNENAFYLMLYQEAQSAPNFVAVQIDSVH